MTHFLLRFGLAGACVLALLGLAAAHERIASNDRIAIVNFNGRLVAGVGIVSTTRIATGSYEVLTNRRITKCACLVTRGSPRSFVTRSGYADCVQREGSAGKGFWVRLFNEAGTTEDGEFMLLAACMN